MGIIIVGVADVFDLVVLSGGTIRRRYRFEISCTGTDVLLDGFFRVVRRATKPFCMHSFSVRALLPCGVMSNGCCRVWDGSACQPSPQ